MDKNDIFPVLLKTRKIFPETPLDLETEKILKEIEIEKHLLDIIASCHIDEFPREQVALIRCALYSALEEQGFELIDKDQLTKTAFHEEDVVILQDGKRFRCFLPLLIKAFSLGCEHLNSTGESTTYVGSFLEYILSLNSYYFEDYKTKEDRKNDFLYTCLYVFNMSHNPALHQKKILNDPKEIKKT